MASRSRRASASGRTRAQGGLFAFVNRRANRLKMLWFDRNGYCLLYKRLHQALFAVPRAPDGVAVRIDGGGAGASSWQGSRGPARAGDRQRA